MYHTVHPFKVYSSIVFSICATITKSYNIFITPRGSPYALAISQMVGWHHRFNGHGFGWTLGVGDGQGGLACCGSWGRKESDMTERLN